MLRHENLIFSYAENVASQLFASQLLTYPLKCMINMNYSAKRKLDFVKYKHRSIEKKYYKLKKKCHILPVYRVFHVITDNSSTGADGVILFLLTNGFLLMNELLLRRGDDMFSNSFLLP